MNGLVASPLWFLDASEVSGELLVQLGELSS